MTTSLSRREFRSADSPTMYHPGTDRMRALIVDDDRTLREGCASVLRSEGIHVEVAARGEEAIQMINRSRFDIMLVDVYLEPVSGIDVLKAVMATAPSTLVVLMTGNPSVESSIEAMRIGAWDYLPKPYSGTQLQLLLGRAAHTVNTRRANEVPGAGDSLTAGANGDLLLGTSAAFKAATELARRAAPTNASVMIVGETGTGKEVVAKFIHQHSRRARKRLVPINCAAIPEQLLESEMFGHRKGAFTGADREKMGLLELANGGTLFLDELTEMSMALQAKMLRVLQDGIVRRVGSEEEDAVVDVRFVSATNRDPRDAIRNKQLREDLYYRLNVVQVVIPPLRDRVEDIPLLANHFLRQFWSRHRSAKDAIPEFSEDTMDFLSSRPWRGNVRELQNFIEHVTILAQPASKIQIHQLPLDQEVDLGSAITGLPAMPTSDAYHVAKEQVLANFEKTYVTRLVARASGNMSRAARLASVDRTTLYRLLERHGFRRDLSDQPAQTQAVEDLLGDSDTIALPDFPKLRAD
ncbi:MAG TPA: sigma-54 dependent transcriptional regulator [Gemmatimonadaceae bacterium]|nr:sigma-54 dependent transcriptional regulator [Gemmatimonadaceae bacterium]